jgi:hypothetical protein
MMQLADHAAQFAADLVSCRRTARDIDRHPSNAERIEVVAKRTANLARRPVLVAAQSNLQLARRRLRHLKIVNARIVFHDGRQRQRHDRRGAAAGQRENQRLIGATLDRHYRKPATAAARRIGDRDCIAQVITNQWLNSIRQIGQ